MDNKAVQERIRLGRAFITKFADDASIPDDYMTDQELKNHGIPLRPELGG